MGHSSTCAIARDTCCRANPTHLAVVFSSGCFCWLICVAIGRQMRSRMCRNQALGLPRNPLRDVWLNLEVCRFQTMPLQQFIKLGAVALGDFCRLGDAALGEFELAGEVVVFKLTPRLFKSV